MSDGTLIDTIRTIMGVDPKDDREARLEYNRIGQRAAMLIFLADPMERFDKLREIVEAVKDALFGNRYAEIAALKKSPLSMYKESLAKVFQCLKLVRDYTPDMADGMWDETSEECTTEFQMQEGWVDKCVIKGGPTANEVEQMVKSPVMMHYFLGENLVKAGLESTSSGDTLDATLIAAIQSHLEFVFLFSWCASLLKHVGEAGSIPEQDATEYDARVKELSVASAAVIKYVAAGLDSLFTGEGSAAKEDMITALEMMGDLPVSVPTVNDGGYSEIAGYVAPMGGFKSRDVSCPSRK